ncbi:hypothetical protein N8I77_009063 [Diaporthe amygdali]|uniref:Uncharacterized protein n=1 Tax=Phomopsis amygdali TaxID=1214568 RepID=A0AAD9S918_PHOAM|nr:hypothetical protein N8I77_009063 [Diaporthe amygdali]
MHDNRTHPLLAQVPLTVSPFTNLPTSITLPYTYKAMPSTLPPSATGVTSATDPESSEKPRYVVSQSGHAAHPDDIIASCRALQAHLTKLQSDAEQELRDLDDRIKARELAEKRRVAPGWLDSDARLLEPERTGGNVDDAKDLMTGDIAGFSASDQLRGLSLAAQQADIGPAGLSEMAAPDDQGAQLDRAFGSLPLRPK